MSEDVGIRTRIARVWAAAEALRIVDFNERKQEFFCRACRYRDPLVNGTKLHDDNCPWVEFAREFDTLKALLASVPPAQNVLCEAYGDMKREVFDKLMQQFKDAHEIRIKTLEPPSGASAEMPRYKCHKEVWALKIADIRFPPNPDNHESDGSMLLVPAESGYAPFRVDRAYMQKHKPTVGGYYVVYKDGYKSFSPADAFEDGYTRI